MEFHARPSQKEILSYRGGKMGISAVPGSGKTWTLSRLAAEIISRGELQEDQEVLVVTLVNSAVENFSNRISGFITEQGLLPKMGYRVRTLHGLAHDIVLERPSLVGLEDHFQIVDEREADLIRKQVALAWVQSHPEFKEDFLSPDLKEGAVDFLLTQKVPDLVTNLANNFIRMAKDMRLTPDGLKTLLEEQPAGLILAEMGYELYSQYQRALTYRGAVDFDDLIRLALDLLEMDEQYLERLRYRWPYVLEDEAQDSSRLQEQILRKLSGDDGNWVRVGDPNQAIFETFTTANPKFLRDFIAFEANERHDLPESGRSQPAIINLANRLVGWVMKEHPVAGIRDALVAPPYIRPTNEGDPQPNPPEDASGIHLQMDKFSAGEEIKFLVESIAEWLPENEDKTVAILVPSNRRGSGVVDALKERRINYVEYLTSTTSTRAGAGALGNLLAYLAEPHNTKKLVTCYQVWRREWRQPQAEGNELLLFVAGILRKCKQVEDYLAPRAGADWMGEITEGKEWLEAPEELRQSALEELNQFRILANRWQSATLLPVGQLVLTLSQDLFFEPAELALSYHLANLLGQASRDHPEWRLGELCNELGDIAKSERKFQSFNPEAAGFDPVLHRGKVVVTTMHKAKGLEWDRVYLTSLNNFDFPSVQAFDQYQGEKYFIRGKLNLEAEALAQLAILNQGGEFDWYEEGRATREARNDYSRERLRLLYVGITRARRELFLTWNTGQNGKLTPAIPLIALGELWLEMGNQHGM